MSRYQLSGKADRDVETIARYSVTQWGLARAESYIGELHQAFETLARFPDLGRSIHRLRPGYLRFEHASHSIFYRRRPDGVLIIRVLHSRMRPDGRL